MPTKKVSKPETPTGKLNKAEQETIIRFDRDNANASLFTYAKSLQKHMVSLGAKVEFKNSFGGVEFSFPKTWVRKPLLPRSIKDTTDN